MSVKEAMQKEVGIIGQKYENRKNKKTGILEERDEKHKQLIFRADDGNSFIVMYSTFRSDWRKSGDNAVSVKISSSEKSATIDTKKKLPVTGKKKLDKELHVLTEKEFKELRMQTFDAVVDALESAGLDYKVKITNKSKGIIVKNGKYRVMEVYVNNREKVFYSVYFSEKIDMPKTYGMTYDYFEKYKLQHRHRTDDLHLKEFIKVMKANDTKKEEK